MDNKNIVKSLKESLEDLSRKTDIIEQTLKSREAVKEDSLKLFLLIKKTLNAACVLNCQIIGLIDAVGDSYFDFIDACGISEEENYE